MDKRNDGGPAFPVEVGWDGSFLGMSRRDYFAAAALTGLTPMFGTQFGVEILDQFADADKELAKLAYSLADAMLKESENG